MLKQFTIRSDSKIIVTNPILSYSEDSIPRLVGYMTGLQEMEVGLELQLRRFIRLSSLLIHTGHVSIGKAIEGYFFNVLITNIRLHLWRS